MTVKRILPFGEPTLRKKAKPAIPTSPKVKKLLDDMTETLFADTGRAALAAPQIGMLRQVIVINNNDRVIELINPEIERWAGEQIGPEACLSFPGYTGIVKRAKSVRVRSLDRSGETWFLEADGHLARCIQHEVDHLNGILFIDHIQGNRLYHDQSNTSVNVLEVLRLSWGESIKYDS